MPRRKPTSTATASLTTDSTTTSKTSDSKRTLVAKATTAQAFPLSSAPEPSTPARTRKRLASSTPRKRAKATPKVKADEGASLDDLRTKRGAGRWRRELSQFPNWVHYRFVDGATLLHLAAYTGHIDALQLLLNSGANPFARDQEGHLPLRDAAYIGKLFRVEALVQAMRAQAQPGQTKTHAVASRLESARFRRVAKSHNRFYPNSQVSQSRIEPTAMEAAVEPTTLEAALGDTLATCVGNREMKALNLLLEAGVEVDCRDSQGDTALHCALRDHCVQATEMLLEAGADPNAADADGNRPLHLALSHGDLDVLDTLVRCGASLMGRDRRGRTPYEVAQARHYHTLTLWFEARMRRLEPRCSSDQGMEEIEAEEPRSHPEELTDLELAPMSDWVEEQAAWAWTQHLQGVDTDLSAFDTWKEDEGEPN